MTLEQATVAIKHGLPVVLINNKISDDSEGKTYTITAITKGIRKYEKNFHNFEKQQSRIQRWTI